MFKIGDKVRGLKNGCTFTNENMEIGIVEDVWTHPLNNNLEYIDVRIIKHKNSKVNSKLYPAKNKSEYFELVN